MAPHPLQPTPSAPICDVDSTRVQVQWNATAPGARASSSSPSPLPPALVNTPFRLRFRLRGKGARLFSFWVGSACGESRGYVAAGSARFNTTRDRAGGC